MIRASNDPEEKRYDFIPEKKNGAGKRVFRFWSKLKILSVGEKKKGK